MSTCNLTNEQFVHETKKILNNKLGSIWYSRKCEHYSSHSKIRFTCSKTKCTNSCTMEINNKSQIAKIYWNEKQHNH